MKEDNVKDAVMAAVMFLRRTEELAARINKEGWYFVYSGTKESASVKRASLDLTRALSRMRQEVY